MSPESLRHQLVAGVSSSLDVKYPVWTQLVTREPGTCWPYEFMQIPVGDIFCCVSSAHDLGDCCRRLSRFSSASDVSGDPGYSHL